MVTRTKSRRRQERFSIAREREASVEFAHAGRKHSFSIYNLSASGVSFTAREDGDFAGLESGVGLGQVVLRLGPLAIRGELLVMHVSDQGAGQICGALFYPATDGDLVKLKGAIAGLEVARDE